MVLQCDQPVPVWGTADPGEAVTVAIASQKVATTTGADVVVVVVVVPRTFVTACVYAMLVGCVTERGEVPSRSPLETISCAAGNTVTGFINGVELLPAGRGSKGLVAPAIGGGST